MNPSALDKTLIRSYYGLFVVVVSTLTWHWLSPVERAAAESTITASASSEQKPDKSKDFEYSGPVKPQDGEKPITFAFLNREWENGIAIRDFRFSVDESCQRQFHLTSLGGGNTKPGYRIYGSLVMADRQQMLLDIKIGVQLRFQYKGRGHDEDYEISLKYDKDAKTNTWHLRGENAATLIRTRSR